MPENDDAIYTSFLGRGWRFPPTFSKVKKTVEMETDVDDIRSSLHILLSTQVGERIMQPKYGCNLDDLIFEPLNTTVKTYISGLVKQAILLFEPRIELNGVTIEAEEELAGRIDVIIDFTVRSTNSRYNLVYPFYRSEAVR